MPPKKIVTLRAVAEKAGTSIQTVSTVLNDSRSNTVVSAETRARILMVANEMQYRRNALARSIRRGYTNIIGFYSGYGAVSQSNPFIAEVFGGIREGCNEHRKDLLIHGTYRGNSVDDIYNELTSGKIDGLVMFSPKDDNLARRLKSAPLPVVAIAEMVSGATSLIMDDIDGGRQALRHLRDLGHRHVLYRYSTAPFVSAQRRLDGIVSEASLWDIRITPVAETDDYFSLSDYEKVLLKLKSSARPTAVVCWCDASAETILQFLFDNDISVPDQMAVVGFDGLKLPYVNGAKLTTLVAPWADVGRRAVSILASDEADHAHEANVIILPMHLRRGNTT